jgi:hypothetical protein
MPLPLGYSYLTSVSGAPSLPPNFIATEINLLCSQDILHEDIPSDPNDPGLPHPDYYDRFVMAVGLGNPNWGLNDDGKPDINLPLGPGVWNNAPDRKPNWTYILPEDTSFSTVLRKAWESYKNYGPLRTDEEWPQETIFASWDSPPEFKENITKERIIYFYTLTWFGPEGGGASGIIRGISSMDLVAQVQGWNGSQWILPQKWGESIPFIYKRGPNEWKAIFDFNRYTVENAQAIAATIAVIMSVIISAATLGAASPVAVAFSAALISGMNAVIKAGLSGDTTQVIGAVMQMGSAVLKAGNDSGAFEKAVGELSKVTKGSSDKVIGWVNDVAKPFIKVYEEVEKIRAQVGVASAYLSSAKKYGVNMPVVNEDYWKKATDPAYLGPFAFWASKAKKFTSENALQDYVNGLPWFAQEIGGFGASIKMTELVQDQERINKSSTSVHSLNQAAINFIQDNYSNQSTSVRQLPKFAADVLPKYKVEIGNGADVSKPLPTPAKVAAGIGIGYVVWKILLEEIIKGIIL